MSDQKAVSRIYCGPSGWEHIEGTSREHPLEFVAANFDVAEVGETFATFPKQELTRVWLRKVRKNPEFLFTAKLNRRFTHDRILDPADVNAFKDGLFPLLRAQRLGCLLMQFPWSFRYTRENREHLIRLRRTFHEFPLAAEMRHESWMLDEAVGTFIDYRIGFCNIDQPVYTRAMPPTAFLTAATGYVRLHGRNSFNWFQDDRAPRRVHRYDYLYSATELAEWKARVDKIAGFAARTFVILNNDAGGKEIVNGLQLRSMLHGGSGADVPAELLRKYPVQSSGALFSTYPGTYPGRAVA